MCGFTVVRRKHWLLVPGGWGSVSGKTTEHIHVFSTVFVLGTSRRPHRRGSHRGSERAVQMHHPNPYLVTMQMGKIINENGQQ